MNDTSPRDVAITLIMSSMLSDDDKSYWKERIPTLPAINLGMMLELLTNEIVEDREDALNKMTILARLKEAALEDPSKMAEVEAFENQLLNPNAS